MSRLSLWRRRISAPSPEEDELEAQRILASEFVARGDVLRQCGPTVQTTGIRITTRRRLVNYTFRNTRLEVDGGPPIVRRWGTSIFPITAGRHAIRCYYPRFNLFYPRCGDSAITIDVPEGQVVAIEYTAPAFFGWSPGAWRMYPPSADI